jgi:hypothetical protein
MKTLLSVTLSTVLGLAFVLPLNAAPLSLPKPEQVQQSAVEQVRHRRHWGHRHGHWRGGRHWNRRYALRGCGYYGCYPRRYYRPYYYRPYYRPYYGFSPYYGHRGYYPHYYNGSGFSIYLDF